MPVTEMTSGPGTGSKPVTRMYPCKPLVPARLFSLILPFSGYSGGPDNDASQLAVPASFAANTMSLAENPPWPPMVHEAVPVASWEKLKPTPQMTVRFFAVLSAATTPLGVPSPASGGTTVPMNCRPVQLPIVLLPGIVVVVTGMVEVDVDVDVDVDVEVESGVEVV